MFSFKYNEKLDVCHSAQLFILGDKKWDKWPLNI